MIIENSRNLRTIGGYVSIQVCLKCQDLVFFPMFLRRTSSGLVVFDNFLSRGLQRPSNLSNLCNVKVFLLRHPLKRHGFGSGFKMILKDDLWSFSTEFSTHDTCMVGLGLVGRVLEDA